MRIKISVEFGRFRRATAGGVLPLFSVLAIPILGTLAAAVDYGVWLERKTHLQAVSDAAALAGAWEFRVSDAAAVATAENFIAGNASVPVEAQVTVVESGTRLRVRLTHDADTVMGGVLSPGATQIAAASTAQANFGGPPCMLALNPTAANGILVLGSAELIAEGCTLWSNADGHQSFRSYPATRTRADAICAVGGVYARGDVQPDPRAGCDPISDPLAGWEPPQPDTACAPQPSADPNGHIILQPGTYCGGLSFENGTVTLQEGVYVIKDGPFSLRGNVEVEGEGVGIYLTGHNARLDFAGTGRLRLTAMTDGPMDGLAIAQDPAAPAGEESQVGDEESLVIGNFRLAFEGMVYLPRQTFTFWGNSDTEVFPPASYIIADRIAVGGNGRLRLRWDEDTAPPNPWLQPTEMVRLVE